MIIIYYLTPTFREVALSLQESLREAGFPCQIAPELVPEVVNDRENLYLLMGLNNPFPYLPPHYIAYQFEQVGSHWFTEGYIDRLRGARMIWDYSLKNLQYLRNVHKLKNTYFVPVGYSPCLASEMEGKLTADSDRKIDILFYGSLNDRRHAILNQLKAKHPEWYIEIQTNLWETERNQLIDQSRIVLNLHYYSEAILETTRLSLLMSRQACVVSERSQDRFLDHIYQDHLSFVESIKISDLTDSMNSVTELEAVCNDLLSHPEKMEAQRIQALKFRDLHSMVKALPVEALNQIITGDTPKGTLGVTTPAVTTPAVNVEAEPKQFDVRVPFMMVEMDNRDDGTSILKLDPPKQSDYLTVSLVTVTRNRSVFLPLMLKNFQSFKYPRELLEWIIIDDSDPAEAEAMRAGLPLRDPRIKYIHYAEQLPIWEKRNLAAQEANHEIIIHLDDDDYYLPESVYAKVKLLKKYHSQGYACLGSREIGIYHLLDNYSFIMKSQMMGEAGMAYYKEFWTERPFKDRELKFGEGAYFLQGRTDQVLDMPYYFNLIALSHGGNFTQGLRKLSPQDQAKIDQNFFNLWEIEVQLFFISLKKKLLKKLEI